MDVPTPATGQYRQPAGTLPQNTAFSMLYRPAICTPNFAITTPDPLNPVKIPLSDTALLCCLSVQAATAACSCPVNHQAIHLYVPPQESGRVTNSNRKTLVSLGMSCQTTHQLRRLVGSERQSADSFPRVTAPSGLFDWLICPMASTVSLLDQGIPDFTRDCLQPHKERAYWPAMNLYFWHGFLVTEHGTRHININQTFERELARWRHLKNRFSALNPEQTVFVISNTQNNLATDVFNEDQRDNYIFSADGLDRLQASLARYFKTGTDNIRLQVLTLPERSCDLSDRTNVRFFPADTNEWKGSKQSWDRWWRTVDYS